MKYDKARKGSRGSASQWNGFLQMHRDYYAGNASNGPIPAMLSNSVIAGATLTENSEDIAPFQPVRIVKQVGFTDITNGRPTYVVEAVDAVDTNGDPTERHGNYGFTLGEGCTSDGGRIVIAGMALVAVTRDQCVEGSKVDTFYGTAFAGYEGKFDSAYYMVPDGTLSDNTDVIIAPVGHFKLVSWYVPDSVEDVAEKPEALVYLAIDMNRRFSSGTAETFGTIAGFSGFYNDTQVNKGTGWFQVNIQGELSALSDVQPRVFVGNPDMRVAQADHFPFLITNTFENDIPGGVHTFSYSEAYNRFVFTGDPLCPDGRRRLWYGGIDDEEPITLGHVGGVSLDTFYAGNKKGYANTDTVIEPYAKELNKTLLADGQVGFAAEYQTGRNDPNSSVLNSNVHAHTASPIVCAMVYVVDFQHKYATFCSELGPQGALISAPWGEFKCIDRYDEGSQPLHNGSGFVNVYERWWGIWQNQAAMSMNRQVTGSGVNDEVVLETSPTAITFPEITVGTSAGGLSSTVRLNHVDNMPNPQYDCSLNLSLLANVDALDEPVIKDSTDTALVTTLYQNLTSGSVTLKALGEKADGTASTLETVTHQVTTGNLRLSNSYSEQVSLCLSHRWLEDIKHVAYEISFAGSVTGYGDVEGYHTIHRRTNYQLSDVRVSGLKTTAADLGTLPTWPTYPNGWIESAGKFN